jgi:hypothetical protein
MPDFKRTQKIFEEQGLMKSWKTPLELLDDELFEAKVVSPDTKTYHQTSDLSVECRKLGENRKSPVRQVPQSVNLHYSDFLHRMWN